MTRPLEPISGGRRELAINVGWLMSDRAGRMAINLIVGVAVARHLGPGDFGVLSFATALAAILAVCAGLGLDEVLVRDLARQGGGGAAWRAAWQLRLFAAVATFVIGVLIVLATRRGAPATVLVSIIVTAGLLLSPAELIDLWFQARGRMRPPALARQSALWLAAGVRLVLVALGASLTAFAWAVLAEAALVAIAFGWIFRHEQVAGTTASEAAVARLRLVREGWPMLASGVLVTITMQLDRLLLGRFCTDAEVGVYAVAARITEVCYALPLAVGAAVMPRLSLLREQKESEYWRVAQRAMGGIVLAGLACAGLLTATARYVVPLVFGARYASSADILLVHAWSLVFVFGVSIRSRLLVIEAGTGWVLIMSLLTALVNVGGNFWLIPRFGGWGAAWAALGSWGCSALVWPWLFAKPRRVMLSLLERRTA